MNAANNATDIRNKRIVIFGLGKHGGGVAATKWAAQNGAAEVVVYDRQPETSLRSSLLQLRGLPIKLKCGSNDPRVIRAADIVIKNPAVQRQEPLLQEAKRIETDLSILLASIANLAPHQRPRCIAVTGTKGKTSTVSAIGYGLEQAAIPRAIAGNIGISIFSILEKISEMKAVVLELSSFQLGDLHFALHFKRRTPLSLPPWPTVAICTNLHIDHLDYYSSMEAYTQDKAYIGAYQDARQWLILNGAYSQLPYSAAIAAQSPAQLMLVTEEGERKAAQQNWQAKLTRRIAAFTQMKPRSNKKPWVYDAYIEPRNSSMGKDKKTLRYSLESEAFVGKHGYNLALAYAALYCAGVIPSNKAQAEKETRGSAAIGRGVQPTSLPTALFAHWPGVVHRMELLGEDARLCFINDTTATIPTATQEAIRTIRERKSKNTRIYLIAGGSDKQLHLDEFVDIARESRLFLLAGSATERIIAILNTAQAKYAGPFASLAAAFDALLAAAIDDEQDSNTDRQRGSLRGATAVAILSPGCASFGMFQHEFDRGEQWRKLVATYLAKNAKQ